MEWVQFITFFVGIFGLFIWNRTESRADIRHMDTRLRAIEDEIKDFHGRLCAIEERKIKILER